MLVPEVPQIDDPKVIELASGIVPSPKLRVVPLRPRPSCHKTHCFFNVERAVEADGGKSIMGWAIWKNPLFVEAEFHAVWQNEEGEVLDITPRPQAVSEILFLENTERKFEWCPVNNIRLPLRRYKAIDDLIKLYDVRFYIENYGENRFVFNPNMPSKLKLPEALIQIREVGLMMIPQLERFIISGQPLFAECFCGRGQPYMQCHRPNILDVHEKVKSMYLSALASTPGKA